MEYTDQEYARLRNQFEEKTKVLRPLWLIANCRVIWHVTYQQQGFVFNVFKKIGQPGNHYLPLYVADGLREPIFAEFLRKLDVESNPKFASMNKDDDSPHEIILEMSVLEVFMLFHALTAMTSNLIDKPYLEEFHNKMLKELKVAIVDPFFDLITPTTSGQTK